MVLFAVLFFLAAIFVLVVKRPGRPLSDSREYRIDTRVVATVLMLLAGLFAAAAWLT